MTFTAGEVQIERVDVTVTVERADVEAAGGKLSDAYDLLVDAGHDPTNLTMTDDQIVVYTTKGDTDG